MNKNMPKFLTFDELMEKANFKIETKFDNKKANFVYNEYCTRYNNNDSGCQGKAIEVLTRRQKSHKLDVARNTQDKIHYDCTAKIDNKLTPCERKSNGGRVDNISTKYVIYSIHIDNSTGKCDICQRIIKTSTFMAKLEELKAIKEVRHNGVVDGLAIQVSKRPLWAWLETMPIYDRTKEYLSSEIF